MTTDEGPRADIDDLFTPPNAAAYEKEEFRTGPPLEYVGEKLRAALYHVHDLCMRLRAIAGSEDATARELIGRSDAAFYQALISFLALYNSLGRLGDWEQQERKVKALRDLDREAFHEWLDSVESEGSVL